MLNFLNSSIIYVSSETGDDWLYNGFSAVVSGTGEGPLRTVDKALEMIYKMRTTGNMQPMTVRIIGDYFIDKPICIGYEGLSSQINKDAEIYGITFEGFGERRARIIGGRRIEKLENAVFNGIECLSAEIPQLKTGEWEFSDLYVNGRRALSTRYPQTGTLRAVTTPTPEIALPGQESKHSDWFIAKKEDLEGITGIENATVNFYHWWVDEHSPIAEFDPKTCRIKMKYYSRKTISAQYEHEHTSNLEYYLENIPQMFKNPGEWYCDREAGRIYYIPEAGEDKNNVEILVPLTDKLVYINGREDRKADSVCFRNLDIMCSKGELDVRGADGLPYASCGQSVCDASGAIVFENAVNCALENCGIYAMGLHAVEILKGCSSLRIENCDIRDVGAGGIKIFGSACTDEERNPTHHVYIRHNKIFDCGKRYAAGCGILACHTHQNVIEENEIAHLDYTGISIGWVWGYNDSSTYGNIVRKNHIHHIGMGKLSDMGGIYLLGRQRGTILDGNIIHDVNSNHYGGNGIYADEGTSFATIENNIVYNCKSVAYNQHYGSYNVVKNNIFAFGGESVVNVYTKDCTNIGTLFEENVFLTNKKPIYHFEPYNKYPSAGLNSNSNAMWDIGGEKPVVYDNGNESFDLEKWRACFGKDENSVVKDPGFSDPENGDFGVKA